MSKAKTLAGTVSTGGPLADGEIGVSEVTGLQTALDGKAPGTAASASVGSELKLFEGTDNGTNYVSFKAANSLAGTVTWTLPTADGTAGQALTTDGSGALAWGSASRWTLNGSDISYSAGNVIVGDANSLQLADADSSHYIGLKAPSTVAANVTYTLPGTDGTSGQLLQTNGSGTLTWTASGSGDVSGPASAGNNAVARYDGTTGKLVQDSSVFIGDNTSGSVTQSTVGAALTNGTYIIQNGITTSGTSIDILGGNMEIRYAGGGGRNAAAGAIVIGGQSVSNSTHRVDILGGEGELSSNNVNIYGGKNNRANPIGLGGNVNLYPGQNPNYAPSSSGNINVQYSTGAGTYAIGWAWSGNTGLPSSLALYNNTSSGGRDLQIASNGALYAVSSSIKYKKDIEDLDYQTTASTIDGLRPIWYRSISPQNDDKEQWSWFGLLAEEVAQVEPRLVQWRTQAVEEYQEPMWAEEGVQLIVDGEPQFDPIKKIRTVDLEVPEPEGVDYARLSVLCLHEIKILRSRVSALEADVALLKNKLN